MDVEGITLKPLYKRNLKCKNSVNKYKWKKCIIFHASFLFIPKGSRVLPLSMMYISLTFRTLSLLDLMSSCGIRVMQKPREAYLIEREPLGIKKKEEM